MDNDMLDQSIVLEKKINELVNLNRQGPFRSFLGRVVSDPKWIRQYQPRMQI